MVIAVAILVQQKEEYVLLWVNIRNVPNADLEDAVPAIVDALAAKNDPQWFLYETIHKLLSFSLLYI